MLNVEKGRQVFQVQMTMQQLPEPDPKGRAKRSLPQSKHRIFSCMLAEVEYNGRPPWAGMRFEAWARNATWKRVLSLQLYLPAIPFCFTLQASMHVEVFEAEEVLEFNYSHIRARCVRSLWKVLPGRGWLLQMLLVSYREVAR
jgi:hypothetical protein